jgi:formate hydrogenlyase subunit 3/multisubunit Na+/H+ antiporter MnhD subunit
MSAQTLLLLPILIPLAVAVGVMPLLRKKPTLGAGAILAAVVLAVLAYVAIPAGGAAKVDQPWLGAFALSFSLSAWKALLLTFVFTFQLMTGVYLLRYIHAVRRPYLFLTFLLVAFAAAAGVLLTDSLFVLLIFWEMFLVALYALIHSGGEAAERVAFKALVIGGTSDFLMILGLMLFFAQAPGSAVAVHIPTGSSAMAFWSFFLLFLGAGAKAGMFPFHTWIPDAAETMPAPGFAALPASLEKILGIYFLFTICHEMFALNAAAQTVMYLFGVATVFVSIVPALSETNFKKVLALTAISPVGFMVAGMATSVTAGMAGALLLMLTHATYKSTMFFAAGNLEAAAGSPRLEDLEGFGRRLPLTGFGFLLAFTAATSLPLTGGFFSKDLIFEGLLERHHYVVFAALWLGAVLLMAVFCKLVAVLWARGRTGAPAEAPAGQVFPVLVLGLGAIGSGWIFHTTAPVIGSLFGDPGAGWLRGVWHIGPLSAVSYAVYLLGALLYFHGRQRCERPAAAFAGLNRSPVLGPALQMAAEKKFDGYEIGVKVVDWVANLVFRYFDRLIDEVADGVIGIGRWLFRPVLSAIHNGVYSNYLGWVIAGLVVVLSFLFIR